MDPINWRYAQIMKIKVVCIEGFSPEYTGGGGYINGIYRYIPYDSHLKPTVSNFNSPFYLLETVGQCCKLSGPFLRIVILQINYDTEKLPDQKSSDGWHLHGLTITKDYANPLG